MKVDMKVEGKFVLVQFSDGAKSFVLQLEAPMAIELSRHLYSAGKKAEEFMNAEQLILDGAVAMRAGLPFSFSSNQKIIDEAAKEAAWNTDLRRFMAGGVKSEEKFGLPSITNTKG
jgi:hypothetical protein